MPTGRFRNTPIDLRHLYAFSALLEDEHFGRAAERLGITQPLLSTRIQALEDLIGERLFVRRPKVAATAAGRSFAPFAESAIRSLEEGAIVASKSASGLVGRLAMALPSWMTFSPVPDAIRDFRREYPDVELLFKPIRTVQQIDEVGRGILQLGFLRDAQVDDRFRSEPLYIEEWLAALPADHGRSGDAVLAIENLNGETVILPDRQSLWLRANLDAMLTAGGAVPSAVQEVGVWLTALSLVAAGAGIAIVPARQKEHVTRGVVYLPLAEPAHTSVSAFWLRDSHDPLLAAFLKILRKESARPHEASFAAITRPGNTPCAGPHR